MRVLKVFSSSCVFAAGHPVENITQIVKGAHLFIIYFTFVFYFSSVSVLKIFFFFFTSPSFNVNFTPLVNALSVEGCT